MAIKLVRERPPASDSCSDFRDEGPTAAKTPPATSRLKTSRASGQASAAKGRASKLLPAVCDDVQPKSLARGGGGDGERILGYGESIRGCGERIETDTHTDAGIRAQRSASDVKPGACAPHFAALCLQRRKEPSMTQRAFKDAKSLQRRKEPSETAAWLDVWPGACAQLFAFSPWDRG